MVYEKALYERALKQWGWLAQTLMMAEEASELSVAALHLLREAKKVDALEQFAEEIADTMIMIEQMKILHPELVNKISIYKETKLQRLEERLGVMA